MTIGKYTQLISSPINRFIFKTLIKISSAKIKKAFLLKEQQSNPVSVCIPCYQMYGKGTLFLNQLLDSLCKQVFKDFEVVISDQSKDSDAIKNCFLTYSDKLNIKYIRHTGASASSNMNNAIKNASYEIVKPLFQDDFLLNPYALYEASLCQTGWGVSSFVHTNKNNSRYFRKMTPSWNDSIIKGINTIGCPSVIYFNKSTATFFDEKLEWLMDCEFYYQLYLLYGEPQISQSIHTCIRLWENSVTHHVTAATKEKEDRYIGKKHKYKPEVFGTSIGNGFSNYKQQVSISVDTLETNKNEDFKVFLQLEPSEILNNTSDIIENKNKFNLILAWDEAVLSQCDNAILFPFGTSWIKDFEIDIENKKCAVSFLMSKKKRTAGHLLRHEIFNNIPDRIGDIDIFKHQSPPRIPNKEDILKPFQFSIIIENVFSNNWFTEKLIDCFMTKTIPIYFGCPNLSNYFNMHGVLIFSSYDELTNILSSVSSEMYFKRIKAIEENFCKASEYVNIWARVDKIIKEKIA